MMTTLAFNELIKVLMCCLALFNSSMINEGGIYHIETSQINAEQSMYWFPYDNYLHHENLEFGK